MAQPVLASSTPHRLEPFLLLAKSARGAACAKLIQDALAAPGVFVFGELLDLPAVHELAKSEQHAKYFRLLEVFAYGTLQDYKDNASTLPPLNPLQLKKLQHLTMVTLSSKNRILLYDDLLHALDIPNVRELEDIIIDAIYQNILTGKLDQKKKCVVVEYAMGRDVKQEQTGEILAVLRQWLRTTEDILSHTDSKVQTLSDSIMARNTHQEQYAIQLEQAMAQVSATLASRTRRAGDQNENTGLMFSDDRDEPPRGGVQHKRKGKDASRR
ncbi:hypothetical protein BC831DRAFT_440816 [Entophlyctis helioformis]|nr:hypothetical protein BC831DRAFT_440816 [Entophlyctis helioformis]